MSAESRNYRVPKDRAEVLEDMGYDPTLYTENREGIVLVGTMTEDHEEQEISQTREESIKKLDPIFLKDTGLTTEDFITQFPWGEKYKEAKELESHGQSAEISQLQLKVMILSLLTNPFLRDEILNNPQYTIYQEVVDRESRAYNRQKEARRKAEISRLRQGLDL